MESELLCEHVQCNRLAEMFLDIRNHRGADLFRRTRHGKLLFLQVPKEFDEQQQLPEWLIDIPPNVLFHDLT